MSLKLLISAIMKFISGLLIVGILLFIPAGTFGYFNAWLFIEILFIPMFIAGIVMMFKNPALLEKRLDAKEKLKEQNFIIKLCGLMFVAGFIIAGLDYRFGWSELSLYFITSATIIFLISYILYAEVLRENAYLSRTIKVEKNQKVISSGLYGIVRHPMYTATIFLFLSMPIILGSFYSFLIFLFYPVLIIKRISSEEKVLEKQLDGYKEYKEKVKYRLIPYIW